jgi:magnesium transporter
VIVKAAVFRDGKVLEHTALPGGIPARGEPGISWIEVFDPRDGDFAVLRDRFGLQSMPIEDSMREVQFPKVDLYDDQVFVVLKSAILEGDSIQYGEIGVFVSARHIVTVYHGADPRRQLLHHQLHEVSKLAHVTPDFILHALLDFLVGRFFPVVQMIEEDVLAMEQHLQDAFFDRAQITRLSRLRREAIHLQHVLAGMADVCGKLGNLEVPCIDIAARPYFRDVHDQLARLDGMVRGLIHVIRTVFEASSLLEIQRQGMITRQLAAWAAILGVPAALAAMYGMVSDDLAMLPPSHRIGIVVTAMTSSCVFLYVRFRKLRWL